MDHAAVTNLVRCYGDRALDVLDVAETVDLTAPLVPGHPPIAAEASYCTRAEMAVRLNDVLARRTRLSLTDPAAGIGKGSLALDVMADAFRWSKRTQDRQRREHREAVESERGTPLRALETPPPRAGAGRTQAG